MIWTDCVKNEPVSVRIKDKKMPYIQ